MALRVSKLFIYILIIAFLSFILWNLRMQGRKKNYLDSVIKGYEDHLMREGGKKMQKSGHQYVDLVIIFTNAKGNYVLQHNLRRTMRSLIKRSSSPIRLHLISDEHGFKMASDILESIEAGGQLQTTPVEMVLASAENLSEEVRPVVEILQKFFTQKNNSYYRDFLFFFSLFLPRILPTLKNIIMVDIDILVKGDITQLYSHFSDFSESQFIGMTPELSPVYYHVLQTYRKTHPQTKFGLPLSKGGFPGFNSGVMLINIPKLRDSTMMQSYMNEEKLERLASKYSFQGHLGDQDFYTLMYLEHPAMFYVLPCEWNRQRCEWWRTRGYESVFDDFFACDAQPKIIHGNCKSAIPEDDS